MAVKVTVRTEAETQAIERYQKEIDQLRKKVTTSSKSVEEFTKEMRKLDSQQRSLNKLTGDSTAKVGKMKDTFGGFVITAGDVWNAAKSVGTAIWDVARAGAEAEKATATLRFSVERAGYAWESHGAAIDANIQKVSWLAAIDDEELAVAQSKLIRSTGELTDSQQMLGLATDISAATGKDLQAVTKALAMAQGGSYTALKKLGVAIGDVSNSTQAMSKLYEQFGGAAGYVNDNLIAKSDRLAIAWGNLKESVGQSEVVGGTMSGQLDRMSLTLKTLEIDPWMALMAAFGGATAPTNAELEAVLGLTDGLDTMTAASWGAVSAQTELANVQNELNGAMASAEQSSISLARAENRVEDTAAKLKDLRREGKQGTREYEDALLDARQAELDLKEAQDKAAENSETLKALERERDALNKLAKAAVDAARAAGRIPSVASEGGHGGRLLMADGGILPATPGGVNVTAAESGVDEAFIPLEPTPRSRALVQAAASRTGATGTAATVIVNIDATDKSSIPAIQAVVRQELRAIVRDANLIGV